MGVDFLTNHLSLQPRNVAIRGAEVVCDVACAFGGPEGRYTFTFGAAGYRDTTFTVDGRFARGSGNCPATASGGMTLRLTLTAQ